MKTKYRTGRFVRLRRYHFREGAKNHFGFAVPSLLASLLVIAVVGLSRVDVKQFLADKPLNNVATAVVKDPEVSALEQAITRANELDRQDKSLAEVIKEQLDNYPGAQEWSVYVSDLDTGRSASINTDKVYDAGSLYKLFLLAPMESKIPVDQWDYYWAGGYNVSSCVELFLSASDDGCAEQIGAYVNWDYADEYNKSVGFINSTLGEGNQSRTNAREVGQLLAQLKSSRVLSDLGRRQVFDTLYYQDYVSGIPAACDDCVVANKASKDGEIVHDAGIVTRGQKSYVVVVMSKGGSYKQIAQITRVIDKQLNP